MAGTRRPAAEASAGSGRGGETRPRRPYLRSADRRRQLLQAATGIAGTQGLEQLTIVGLAAAAGVSRQLVYDHFSDLPSLVAAMIMDHFAAIDEAMARTAEPEAGREPLRTAAEAGRRYLELPREDRHILRSLMSYTDAPGHELNRLAIELRERSISRWQPILCPHEGSAARARTWATVQSLQALGDLLSTGVITLEQALAEFLSEVAATLDAPLPAAAPRG